MRLSSLRLVLLAALASAAVACSGSDPPPPPDPRTTVRLAPGERVVATNRGRAEEGEIVQVLSSTHVVVRYDTDGADEVVFADRLTRAPARGPSISIERGARLILSLPNVKRQVLVEVEQPVGSKYRVRYLGFEPPAFDDVPPERLKRPFGGKSAFKSGDVVFARVDDGREMRGTVAAVVAQAQWLVRFDGFGPQYDQVLGESRVRAWEEPPPPAPPKPPAPKHEAGSHVVVASRGVFHAGVVSSQGADGAYKVKFDSPKLGEEELGAEALLKAPPLAKGDKLVPHQIVLVEVHGVWLPAKVIKESGKGGAYQIRFDGEPATSDEVVPTKRLRAHPSHPPPAPAPPKGKDKPAPKDKLDKPAPKEKEKPKP